MDYQAQGLLYNWANGLTDNENMLSTCQAQGLSDERTMDYMRMAYQVRHLSG